MTTTYIADYDLRGREMERPFLRVFLEADSEEEALGKASAGAEGDEVVRAVEPFQPILDAIREKVAAGGRFTITHKAEDGDESNPYGPVWVEDSVAADAARGDSTALGIPFGSDPDYLTSLPWMTRREARRLAKYLGLSLGTS